MATGSTPSPDSGGIGIDLAEPGAFGHLDADAIARASRRWLTQAERDWCAAQPSFCEAMVTVLSCKESVFKASGGLVPVHEVTLRMEGDWRSGWGLARVRSSTVTVRWVVSSGRVLTLGAAGPHDQARLLLDRIIRGRSAGDSV